jgi:hypothetical protein
MQHRDEDSPRDGAFHYSYFLGKDKKEDHFVVGTTSKTIFTLLKLHERTGDDRYLEAARRGADWLTTMVRDDGSVKPHVRLKDEGNWVTSTQSSTLYNGQTLSALSRMHRATGEPHYKEAAERIALYLQDKVTREGCYIGDDYRTPNPISSSRAILSLIDFERAWISESVRDLIFRCSDELVKRQITEGDAENFGQWRGAFSSSGNGWVAEVLMEVYRYCEEVQGRECGRYRASAMRGVPWLARHTYGEENSALLPNPARARGGIFWSMKEPYVRTDSVSHGLNAYVMMEQME